MKFSGQSNLLGIDYGEKNIGVAVGGPDRLARRLMVVPNGPDAATELASIASRYHTKTVVLGRPRTLEGELGYQADKVLEFGKLLHQKGLDVRYEDESATTDAAYHKLTLEGIDKKHQKALVDMVAAEIILQGYLDSIA